MTTREIEQFMESQGIDCQHTILDGEYSLPDKDWFYGEFYQSFQKYLWQLGLLTYEVDANDCDDFSDKLRAWAQTLEALDKQRTGRALAVGVLGYYLLDNSGGAHAIAFAICKVNGQHELCCIEPQNGQAVNLTELEKEVCIEWRI